MAMTTIWTERVISHLEAELDYYGRINPILPKELPLIYRYYLPFLHRLIFRLHYLYIYCKQLQVLNL
jgi:hypothetical protein